MSFGYWFSVIDWRSGSDGVVERFFHDFSGIGFAADFDLDGGAGSAVGRGQVGHADAHLQGGGQGAAANLAQRLAFGGED